MLARQSDATLEELAVELMMVGLSLQFTPHLTGYHHVQTNPKWAYSTRKTVKNAERLVAHAQHLSSGLDPKRICIKIPSTWEGLQACRELEAKGIATLATTLFCMAQASAAADAGCRYIAPYVNELRVHFDPGYVDADKAFDLCNTAQKYFHEGDFKTQVLAASLTSIEEVMQLAGVHHITVSPVLLAELASTPAEPWAGQAVVGETFRAAPVATNKPLPKATVDDESEWRLAFTRSDTGKSEAKLSQAISIFSDSQDALEEMVRQMDPMAKTESL